MLTAASACLWCRDGERNWGSEGPGEYDASLSLPRSSTTGCSERVSYSVELLYEAAVIKCLYQPGRAGGAYPIHMSINFTGQDFTGRLDVILAGHVTLVAQIGRRYEFWLTFTLHANHAMHVGHCSSIATWYWARYRMILIVPNTTEYWSILDTRCFEYRSFSSSW